MAYLNGPQIVRNGLVLYLDAGNRRSYSGSGTSWVNLIDTTKVGTLVNGPTFDSANGGSIVFDGVNDSHSIGSLGLTGFTQFTVNIWYYSNVNSSTALARSLSIAGAFILHYRGAGFYLVANDNTISGYLGWQTTIPFNQWMMLTGTWNGSVMKLYQNGIKQANERSFTGGANGILATINTMQLGYDFNIPQPWTNGKIASCTLYNRALTDEEVFQNFNATRSRFGV
jgi:hypothetical protein